MTSITAQSAKTWRTPMCCVRMPERMRTGDLGGEDDGHEGRADASHQFRRGRLLEECLRGNDDRCDGDADDEVADQSRPDVREHGEDDQTMAMPKRPQ